MGLSFADTVEKVRRAGRPLEIGFGLNEVDTGEATAADAGDDAGDPESNCAALAVSSGKYEQRRGGHEEARLAGAPELQGGLGEERSRGGNGDDAGVATVWNVT